MKSNKDSLLSDLNQHQIRHRIKAVKWLSILISATILLKELHQVPGTRQGEEKCSIHTSSRGVGIKY